MIRVSGFSVEWFYVIAIENKRNERFNTFYRSRCFHFYHETKHFAKSLVQIKLQIATFFCGAAQFFALTVSGRCRCV